MATEWWQKSNGQILRDIEFTATINAGGVEESFTFKVASPPIYDHDSDLFTRLSFERIQDVFKDRVTVGHIIRGHMAPNGCVRDCYVYGVGRRVPFAVIRPTVFTR